eukprot:1136860-Pelagomonas_calceolata.AAC.3
MRTPGVSSSTGVRSYVGSSMQSVNEAIAAFASFNMVLDLTFYQGAAPCKKHHQQLLKLRVRATA